jgi:diguanylate cyclase (GGDEF)-like protein
MSAELYDQIPPEDMGEVQAHCVKTLFDRVRLATLFAPLGTLFIFWIGYSTASLPLAIGWMIVNTVPYVLTLLLAMRFQKNPPPLARIAVFHNTQVVLRTVQGLCWGAAVVVFHGAGDSTAISDMIILTALASISATSLVNMAPSFRTQLGFAIALMIVPILYFVWLGDATHIKIAVGLCILLLVEIQFGWDAYRQFAGGVHQLVLNRRVQRQLEHRNAELDELNQKLKVLAIHDQLTGLYNRHYLVDQMGRQRESLVRHGCVSSIVLFDIDHFKQINDSYGHAVGDDVLVAFSRRVEGLLRQGDMLGRHGGEEFMLLLPMTDANAAMQLAERVRGALAASPVVQQPQAITVTASFGVAQLASGEEADDWLLRADQALYRAKEHGRNCVMA